MAKAGAVLLGIVGLITLRDGITGRTTLSIPEFTKPYIGGFIEKATFAAALIAGVLVGLCAFPCVGGLYVAIITMMTANGMNFGTLGLLALYNLMFVLPLILALLFASEEHVLNKL